MNRSGVRWPLLVLVLSALGACGLSPQESATRIAADDVPYALLDPAPTVTTQPAGRAVDLCLLRDDLLVRVGRSIEPPAALIDVARALAVVTADEEADGLRTSIVASDDIVSVQRSAGVATVALAADAGQRLTADPLATVAQLVCTLTRQPGVGLVRFTIDDIPTEVPRADGSLSNGPVSADDYASMRAPEG